MQRSFGLFLALATALAVQAQNVGVNADGSAPHLSALLDVDASALPANGKRGLLIPRMTSTERAAIPMPATGLLVYDATLNAFWYFDGTAWVPLLASNTGWGILGNAGTNPATNFLGTTNNVAFAVRVNNERAGFLSPTATNTSWGHLALAVATGGSNTAVGKYALVANTTGSSNTVVGSEAMDVNTTGVRNTALGAGTLHLATTVHDNTALGYRALRNTTVGGLTAVGANALFDNSTGTYNTAVGLNALTNNTTGLENSALGHNSLTNTTTGEGNTAVGAWALRYNTTGSFNTAVGREALEYSGTGTDNTAVGHLALWATSTGSSNSALGEGALQANNSGAWNTAVGRWAMHDNTSGHSNSAVGSQALDNNTTGDYNTAMGRFALFGIATQSYNTHVGYYGGNNTYSNSTLLGAAIITNANGYTNFTALGYGTTIDGSNRVRVGNVAVTSIGGFAGWTTLPSDGRFKREVREDVAGLPFILALRPVTYQVDVDGIVAHFEGSRSAEDRANADTTMAPPEITAAYASKAGIRYTGFIAQEVDRAARAAGFDFSGVDRTTHEDQMMGLRYAEFVVPLVKAVQEQQAVIEQQRLLIQQLTERIDRIEKEP